jgi:hypothetical protein
MRFVFSTFLISRLFVWITAFLFEFFTGGHRTLPWAMCNWDCHWYLTIINGGYHAAPILTPHHPTSDPANWAFFPFFPVLSGLIANLTGMSGLMAAYLVSNLSLLFALVFLFQYSRKLFSEETSRFIVMAIAFSPFSYYFSAAYTESPYFLFMIGAFYFARNGAWITAGFFAAFLTATRNLGVTIFFSFLILAVKQFGFRSLIRLQGGSHRAVLALALVPLGLFAYMFYLYQHVGDPLAFLHVQAAWGNEKLGNPLMVMWRAMSEQGLCGKFRAGSGILGLVAGVYLWRKGLAAEALIPILGTLIPFAVRPNSMQRYVLTLFPVFVALGMVTENRSRLRRGLLIAFVLICAYFIGAFVGGRGFTT